jgi:TetR/AcrR family transcriptional repressor of nem operon
VADKRTWQITSKGQATRDRIVIAAAALFRDFGVAATTIERIRSTALVSGSQISHYFGSRVNLIRAVIDWYSTEIVADHDAIRRDQATSMEARLSYWATRLRERHSIGECGNECAFGALASELVEQGDVLRAALAAGYRRWADCICDDLQPAERWPLDLDRTGMAFALLAAHQGGSLIAHISANPAALAVSLDAAVAVARSGRPTLVP